MRVYITATKIQRDGAQTFTLTGSAGDRHLELADCELFAEGTVLAVLDLRSGTKYTTDFAYASVAAVLTAAAGSGGFFVLT
jgi:hypothetical protein